jgi:hypothetical protein
MLSVCPSVRACALRRIGLSQLAAEIGAAVAVVYIGTARGENALICHPWGYDCQYRAEHWGFLHSFNAKLRNHAPISFVRSRVAQEIDCRP